MFYPQLLVDMLLGAFTGYLTNLFALNMLFRKYLGLGGLIIDTREQLIENVSALVEREIINNKTIEGELDGPEFRTALQQTVADFLQRRLDLTSAQQRIADIPGFEQTRANLRQFGREKSPHISGQLLAAVFKHTQVKDVLSPPQMQHLGEFFWDASRQVIQERGLAQTFFKGLYQENHHHNLSALIPDDFWQLAADNLVRETADFHRHLAEHWDAPINTVLADICRQLQIPSLLEQLSDRIQEKPLSEMLNVPEMDHLTNELLSKGLLFLQTETGQPLLEQLAAGIIDALKSIQLSPLDLLQMDLQPQLEIILAEELPPLIEKIVLWIKANQRAIEALIDSAVDEVLSSEAGDVWNIKGKTKKAVKDLLWPSLSAEYNLVDRIVAFINQDGDAEKISRQLTQEMLKLLGKNSLGKIAAELERRQILTADLLSAALSKNLTALGTSLDLHQFEAFWANPMGKFLSRDRLADALEKLLGEQLIPWVKKEFLYTDKATALLQQKLTAPIKGLGKSTIGQLISPVWLEQALPAMEEQTLALLDRHKTQLIRQLTTHCQQQWGGLPLAQVLPDQITEQLTAAFAQWLGQQLEQQLTLISGRQLAHYHQLLLRIPQLEDKCTASLLNLMHDNLERLFTGQIQNTVSSGLSRLSDDELRVQMEQFMGRELQPITLFGGFWGMLGGALSFYLGGLPTPHWALAMVTPLLIYSGIGYGTNALALRMIFKPYRPKHLLGLPVPFTPGVVVKQKPRFAQAMGDFVGNELFNETTAQEFFKRQRPQLTDRLFKRLTADDNRLIKELLAARQTKLADWLFQQTLQFSAEKQDLLAKSLTQLLCGVNPAALLAQIPRSSLSRSWPRQQQLADRCLTFIGNTEKPLQSIFPEQSKQMLLQALQESIPSGIQAAIGIIADEQQWARWIQNAEPRFNAFTAQTVQAILDKLPADADGHEWLEGMSQDLLNLLKSTLREPLQSFLQAKLNQETDPNRTLQDVFGGQLVAWLKNNTDPLLSQIHHLIIQLLIQAKPAIVKTMRQNIAKKGFFYSFLSDLLNTDDTISKVVDTLVHDGIPRFLAEQQPAWKQMLTETITNNLAPMKISRLQLTTNQQPIAGIVTNILNHPGFTPTLTPVFQGCLQLALQIPLQDLLQAAGIKGAADLYQLFREEIIELRQNLIRQLDEQSIPIANQITALTAAILEEHLLSLPLNRLTAGVTHEQLRRTGKTLLSWLNQSAAVDQCINTGLDGLQDTLLLKKTSLLHHQLLLADLQLLLPKLTGNQQLHGDLNKIFHDVTQGLLQNDEHKLLAVVDPATLDYLLQIIIASGIDALEENMAQLISALNVQDVTVREINKMQPRQIDSLFDSFAGKYFTRLKLYGLSGGLLGLVAASLKNLLP